MESGQYFAYSLTEGWYTILHRNITFRVRQEGDWLRYEGIGRDALVDFFRLDEDHNTVLEALGKDVKLREALSYCRGLRLLRQDPWQCTVGFVCSQNSNIPRIKQNITSLTQNFGDGMFPMPGSIVDKAKLQEARLGYREKYLLALNTLVDDDYFKHLKTLNYEEAKSALMKLPGIGSKVADCILLFSLDKLSTFPVDVWIKRVVEELYFNEEKTMNEIIAFASSKWGEHAGYAQQYLYHWRRQQ